MNNKFDKILGSLETEIMEIIWTLKNASVRDVLNSIKRKDKPAYTTVMTVMSRLCEKGHLKRKLNNDCYSYWPAQDKQSFLSTASKKIINNLFKDFGNDIAMAQFLDHIENNDLQKSEELRKKLLKIIKE